ncbi:uncharacterized protein LOC133778939 [Humulus lupulus]|uniref:uncharacterized protein LOC133778939 n=1 Tax=Humulus lupulus TaxID=3486 RepID=UPI002B403148|nr:uncharacterized protein LOC133778939 [Humulus lupulus]
MARRKKNSQKPATRSNVPESPLLQETCEGQRSGLDDDMPDEMEEVFKDSMVDFPEMGNRGPMEIDEESSGGKRNEENRKEMTAGESEFQSQAKDKWTQFRSLLPNQGGAKLKFEEPLVREGQRIAQVDLEEIQVETSFWNSAVLCMVLGASPPFAVFEGFIKRIWATRDLVLEVGVLHFDRKPVIVKPLSADLDTLKAVKTVPVWIRLPGLGLKYWGTKCLSALMSTIGNPILVDKVTKDRTMVQFARVLVEKRQNGEEETKQDPVDQKSLSEDKDAPSGGIDVDAQKLAANEVSESQEVSKQHGHLADSMKQVDKLDKNSSDRSNSEWTTPKRVGGKKKTTLKAQNKLKNSYSALQEKVLEVTNLGLSTTRALLETKLRGDKIEKMMSSFFIGWSYFSGSASEGRILLIWQRHWVTVEVLKESDQLIHVCVKEVKSNKMFYVMFVYDRVGGRTITTLELVDAQNWRALGLVDELRSGGSHYTWTNKQANEDIIYSKLDRIFKNEEWLDLFPQAEAIFNWEMLSDHCYCIIKSGTTINCGMKPFRFFNLWIEHGNFKDIVMQSWCKPSKGYGLDRIVRKLGRLQIVLRKFNKNTVGDVAQNYILAKDNYQASQLSLQSRKAKLIGFVMLIERFDDVVAHFVNHFRKIMGSQSNASVPIQHSCFRLGHRLSLDQQIGLVRPFTSKEVKYSLFSIISIKSLGPDGYRPGFFKAMWSDIGAEISEAIFDFFERGILPEEDIIKGYKRKNISPRCVMKIDLSKAYDMLDWNFLEGILIEFSFPNKFIKWVMTCLKDPAYLILMNGRIQGGFRGQKGLRQGDPISPLLFELAMEYCTQLLCQASMGKGFRYHSKCKPLKIVNLCFADDLVIFCKGVSNSVQIMKDCFTEFCLAFGLSANMEKSQVYFGGLLKVRLINC